MAACRELITLQFGHYSNFVGTHWWNIQESSFCYDPKADFKREINHDCLFREGRTHQEELTYTPRLLVFDLKGSLRSLPKLGSLYNPVQKRDDFKWAGELSIHRSEAEPKNEFQRDIEFQDFPSSIEWDSRGAETKDTSIEFSDRQENKRKEPTDENDDDDDSSSAERTYNLDNEVTVWSDYLSVHFHPRTIHFSGNYLHEDEMSPFDVFGNGQELMRDGSFVDELEDGLHFFAEECDSLQGFQVIADVYNGFGGLSSQVLEYLHDDYGSKSFLTFGVTPAHFPTNSTRASAHRILNTALSFAHLSKYTHLLAPLSMATDSWYHCGIPREFPHLSYKFNLPYHTSAILAACIDSLTLPYRLDTGFHCHMSNLLNSITFGGRNVANVAATLPVPLQEDSSLSSLLSSRMNLADTDLLKPLTPGVPSMNSIISQAVVLRGVTPSYMRNHQQQKSLQSGAVRPFESCSSASEMLDLYFRNMYPGSAQTSWSVNQACMTKAPFPNIFTGHVRSDGVIVENYAKQASSSVNQTSVLSCVNTSPATGGMLQSLAQWARKVNIQRYHSFFEGGIELSSFQEALELLESLSQQYELR